MPAALLRESERKDYLWFLKREHTYIFPSQIQFNNHEIHFHEAKRCKRIDSKSIRAKDPKDLIYSISRIFWNMFTCCSNFLFTYKTRHKRDE